MSACSRALLFSCCRPPSCIPSHARLSQCVSVARSWPWSWPYCCWCRLSTVQRLLRGLRRVGRPPSMCVVALNTKPSCRTNRLRSRSARLPYTTVSARYSTMPPTIARRSRWCSRTRTSRWRWRSNNHAECGCRGLLACALFLRCRSTCVTLSRSFIYVDFVISYLTSHVENDANTI